MHIGSPGNSRSLTSLLDCYRYVPNQMRRQARLDLAFRAWGGCRAGAGRKAVARPRVSHRRRPPHDESHPVHVTMRAARGLSSLRKGTPFTALRDALAASSRASFRVLQFCSSGPSALGGRDRRADGPLSRDPGLGDPSRESRQSCSRPSRPRRGRQVSRTGAHDTARGATRAGVRPEQSPQARAGSTRDRSVLVGRLVHRLEGDVFRELRAITGRTRPHVACKRRLVAARSDRPRRGTAIGARVATEDGNELHQTLLARHVRLTFSGGVVRRARSGAANRAGERAAAP
jgi:hypothetical protein